jgi:DNA-directed RNA polymerase subunit H (RpoH/RPB5)
MSGTTQLTETYFAAYTPVAVEDFGDGDKRFVLKHSTGSLLTFSMSATWTRTGNLPWIETNDPTAFNTAERDYGVDFDNDGNTGLIFTPIETAGSTALRRDQSGRLYAGSQPIYLSGTTQLTETYFAAYTPVAVEDFGDGDKRLLLEHSTGSLLTFSMSSTWTRTGNLPWIEVDDSVAFNAAEAEYGVDFDGDA